MAYELTEFRKTVLEALSYQRYKPVGRVIRDLSPDYKEMFPEHYKIDVMNELPKLCKAGYAKRERYRHPKTKRLRWKYIRVSPKNASKRDTRKRRAAGNSRK